LLLELHLPVTVILPKLPHASAIRIESEGVIVVPADDKDRLGNMPFAQCRDLGVIVRQSGRLGSI